MTDQVLSRVTRLTYDQPTAEAQLVWASELCVVGGLLIRPEAIQETRNELLPRHFMDKRHRKIYEIILDLDGRRQPIDCMTIHQELVESGADKRILHHLALVLEAVPISASLAYHVNFIKRNIARQRLVNISTGVLDRLKKREPVEDVLEELRNLAAEVIIETDDGVAAGKDVIMKTVKNVEEAMSRQKANQLAGLSTGFLDLDRKTGGFRPGELIIVAGRPGMGKSALAKDIAERCGVPALVFSIEMSAEEIQLRQLAGHCQINLKALRCGDLNDMEWERLIEGANQVMNLPINFYDRSIAIEDLVNIASTMQRRRGVGIIIVDYLQLVSTRARTSNRNEEIGRITGKLKQLARDLGIPVVALSQLNRKCEDEKRRPNMRDLRESGNIEQDADIVAFVYRDHVYHEASPEYDAELIIAKGRNITIGTVHLYWDGPHQTFRDLSRREGLI